ncbi:Gfo/Idh/MocA family protein [Aquisphaera insulae]|uniref:Gfo/Idh/MocA family protein n=1 Tax=Aquisphaera insulae TaxID=2712864 RepID=UPI0013EB519A|nr:Gfo/Idh/MocA family oxidoreductase [Aquisphaera insulae]
MIPSVDRRSFLHGASVAGFGIFANGRRGFAGGVGPNEVINIACIGVGGKGSSDAEHAGHHGRVVALCDIDDVRAAGNYRRYPDARRYHDYRALLDEMGAKIDAVVVSTPDHHHAPAAVRAMRMGKHVYCQKPLTHSVWEARLMRETAREKKVCTQMGNQGSASPGLRRGVEILQSGAIGDVAEVHVWTNRPFKYWKQAPDIVARTRETPGIPNHIHWFEFLGPAPDRPYHPSYHPHNWRGFWDFGTGSLGDMACHTANLAFRGLKLGLPTRVSAEHSEINSETFPAWATITYEFPAREGRPPVKLVWHEGARNGERNLPPDELFPSGFKKADSGSLFLGSKGRLYSPSDNGTSQVLFPEAEFRDYQAPTPTLPRIKGSGKDDDNMKKEWIEAVRAGKPELAYSNFDFASALTESMLLGNVAVRSEQAIEYDGASGRILNSEKASQYLKPYFRKGWEI